MKKILVPVDFGKEAAHAADYAMKLAQNIGAEVSLYHAYVFPFTPITVPSGNNKEESPYLSKDVIDHLTEQMGELRDRLREEYPTVKLHAILDEAFPEYGVTQKAEDLKSDLIVMTPRQIPRLVKWFTGSVSEKIIDKSSIPVLIVPGDYEFKVPNHLLYASNFDRVDGEKIKTFLEMFESQPSRLYVSFIFEDEGRKYPPSEFSILKDVLKEHIAKSLPNREMKFLVTGEENVFEGLEEQIEDFNIDLMAMTTHQRGFFDKILNPSKTHRMVYETEVPLLIFHAEVSNEGALKEKM
ncbi:MAG: universal stress protein [Bacteroidia bacterium]|nr:universal stress protein [Bacteroidia bacterium]